MRPNNPSKRLRGRNRSKNTNPLARSYESNGPDVKIRGSAMQVADKYAQLARDAQSSGDRIMAENYLQHAEHYYRIVATAYEQSGQGQANQQGQSGHQRERSEENGRYEDRNFRNEQPTINGYDGVDDDSGLRRTLKANGTHPNASEDGESDGEGAVSARSRRNGNNGNGQHRRDDEAEEASETVVPVLSSAPDPAVEAAPAGESAEEEKPKRRRAPRARTRTRRTEPAESAPPEANEPTS